MLAHAQQNAQTARTAHAFFGTATMGLFLFHASQVLHGKRRETESMAKEERQKERARADERASARARGREERETLLERERERLTDRETLLERERCY